MAWLKRNGHGSCLPRGIFGTVSEIVTMTTTCSDPSTLFTKPRGVLNGIFRVL